MCEYICVCYVWVHLCVLCVSTSVCVMCEYICVCYVWVHLCVLCVSTSVCVMCEYICVCYVWVHLCVLCGCVCVTWGVRKWGWWFQINVTLNSLTSFLYFCNFKNESYNHVGTTCNMSTTADTDQPSATPISMPTAQYNVPLTFVPLRLPSLNAHIHIQRHPPTHAYMYTHTRTRCLLMKAKV